MFIWNPVDEILGQVIPMNTADSLFSILIFTLTGSIGVIFIRYKEAPIFLWSITGIPAILLGLITVIFSSGIIILVIFNYYGHPLIR